MEARRGRLLWWGPTCRAWPRRHPPAPAPPGPSPGPRSASAPSAPRPAAARGSVGREEGRQTFPESRDRPARGGRRSGRLPAGPARAEEASTALQDAPPGAFELDAKRAASRGCRVTVGGFVLHRPSLSDPCPPTRCSAPAPPLLPSGSLHPRISGRGHPGWGQPAPCPLSHPVSCRDLCPEARPHLQSACVALLKPHTGRFHPPAKIRR